MAEQDVGSINLHYGYGWKSGFPLLFGNLQVMVNDQQGAPLALGKKQLLTLPAGLYQLTLKNPLLKISQSLPVQVAPLETVELECFVSAERRLQIFRLLFCIPYFLKLFDANFDQALSQMTGFPLSGFPVLWNVWLMGYLIILFVPFSRYKLYLRVKSTEPHPVST
jgi:hypothetical protein